MIAVSEGVKIIKNIRMNFEARILLKHQPIDSLSKAIPGLLVCQANNHVII
jgi:hypothetical protein